VNGSIAEEYIFFGGARIARRDASGGAVHYYFADHLGSSDVITSNTGVIQKETDFTPYGGEVAVSGSDTNHFKFTGKERDSETGLDNFGARFYASSFGRFMTPDWAARPTTVPYASFGDPQTLNLYTYVENAPVNRADADGHEGDCEHNPFLAECSSSGNTKNGGESEAQKRDKADLARIEASAAQDGLTLVAQEETPELIPKNLENEKGEIDPNAEAERALEPVEAKPEPTPAAETPEQKVLSQHPASEIQAVRNGACSVDPKLEEAIRVNDTVNRIRSAGTFPFKQDNTVFKNLEGRLPQQPAGYYKEFTVSPASGSSRGAMRLVTGAGGEIYQTDDH
jgi:RHS repeat-associated protein